MVDSFEILLLLIIIFVLIGIVFPTVCSSCFVRRFYRRNRSGYDLLPHNDSVDTLPLYTPRSNKSQDPPPYTEFPEPLISIAPTPILDENVLLEPLVPQDMDESEMRSWLAIDHLLDRGGIGCVWTDIALDS
jgi:hypothetical protein